METTINKTQGNTRFTGGNEEESNNTSTSIRTFDLSSKPVENTETLGSWDSRVYLLKQFIKEYSRFPKSSEQYKDFNIGNWFMHQRKSYAKNVLALERIDDLDAVSTAWRGTPDELKEFNKEKLVERLLSQAKQSKGTPVTEMYEINRDELLGLMEKNILTCEDVLESTAVSIDTKLRALATINKDKIKLGHLRLLEKIRKYNYIGDLYYEINIDMLAENMDDALSKLDEHREKVVRMYYNLDEQSKTKCENPTYREIASILDVSHEKIRKDLMQAYKELSTKEVFTGIISRGSKLYDNIPTND